MMYPKTKYVRSPAILVACRKLACQACGTADGTVVAAHSNWAEYGAKGKAIKADDRYVAAMCYRCHCAIDQGARLSRDARKAKWLHAHTRTIDELVRLNLWPKGLELPQ